MEYQETVFDKIEAFMNHLTDSDMAWYPFVFLRPAPHERMDIGFLAKISLYFGPLTGLVLYLGLLLTSRIRFDLMTAFIYIIVGIVIFFVFYRFTFSIPWNRRADRMTKSKRKPEQGVF